MNQNLANRGFFVISLLFSSIFFPAIAQKVEINSSVSASGYYSSQDALPFWMVSNRNGAISSTTDGLFEAATNGSYNINEKPSLEVGASVFVRNGLDDEFQRNELFVKYTRKYFQITAGSENPEQEKFGVSSVHSNFLIAGNSRAIPGISIKANEPIPFLKHFTFDWGIGHYMLNDTRFVDDVLLHYKHVGVDWNVDVKNTLRGELIHYAQWGGNSPEFGELGTSFRNFVDMFVARESSSGSVSQEQINSLGNHLGIFNFEYIYKPSSGKFVFYHQHPFEDGSGTRLANFPDGIWGFYFEPNNETYTNFIKGFSVEYFDTTDQSGRVGFTSKDNYFNSGLYRSGWTYEGNIIGLPFIFQDPSGLFISNNIVRGIHVGLSAGLKRLSFKTKLSFVENMGTFRTDVDIDQKVLYSYLQTKYSFESLGDLTLHLGGDFGDLDKDVYSAGLQYTYSF